MKTANTFRLLIVDDQPLVLSALEMVLEVYGHQITTCESAQRALDVLNQDQNFDAIVTDLRMPEMDGIELIKVLSRTYPIIPRVLMSGHATQEERLESEKQGSQGFLSKPFTPDQLKDLLTKLTGK